MIILAVMFAGTVITGGVVSTTFTVRVTGSAAFKAASLTL